MAELLPISRAENSNINTGALGTVIRIAVKDDSVNDAIEAGFTHLVVERSEDLGLSWEEETLPSERPVLATDVTTMQWIDRRGDPNYLYRTRYIGIINGTSTLSTPGESIPGVGIAVRNLLTVDQLKARYMFGLDLTDDKGEPLEDDVFLHYILSAIRQFEHEVDIPLLPTTFIERHDYYRGDYHAFDFIKLDNSPVISIEEFRVQYPSGQNVVIFPSEWIRLNKLEGQVQIVPTSGTLSEILVGQGGSFLPAIYNGLDYLPQLFELAYTAGFEDGKIPRNIINAIGMIASIGPFHIFGDLIAGAGIANISLSMDGLSQSIGTTSSATNCLSGDALIYTDGGQTPLRDLLGKAFRIWDGDAWFAAEAIETGEREIAVTQLGNGRSLRTSPDHLFRVLENSVGTWKCQRDLKQGDAVLLAPPHTLHEEHLYPNAKVVESWSTGKREDMFDVKVANDRHLFFANGMGVHNSGYGARVGNYLKELKDTLPKLRQYYRGVKFTVA